MSQHAADVRRRLPRKTIIIVVAAALALIAGVAFALYLFTAKMSGTATSKTIDYVWSTTTPTSTGSACGSMSVVGNILNWNVSGYPGDTCTVTANLKTTGSETAKVTGIALTGLPSGWSAEVDPATCGKTVQATDTPVTFKVTVGTGSSNTGSVGGGLQLTPTSQVSGSPTCTVQTIP